MNSSRGCERVPGTPQGSVKFRYTIWTSRAVLVLAAVPNLSRHHLHHLSGERSSDGPFPFQALMVPSLLPSPHPPDTTSSHHHFHCFTHSPYSAKDAAQGCNKIHTKVIFHKEKKLRNNCSSNAQQASDSWLPAWGALVMCS